MRADIKHFGHGAFSREQRFDPLKRSCLLKSSSKPALERFAGGSSNGFGQSPIGPVIPLVENLPVGSAIGFFKVAIGCATRSLTATCSSWW